MLLLECMKLSVYVCVRHNKYLCCTVLEAGKSKVEGIAPGQASLPRHSMAEGQVYKCQRAGKGAKLILYQEPTPETLMA